MEKKTIEKNNLCVVVILTDLVILIGIVMVICYVCFVITTSKLHSIVGVCDCLYHYYTANIVINSYSKFEI